MVGPAESKNCRCSMDTRATGWSEDMESVGKRRYMNGLIGIKRLRIAYVYDGILTKAIFERLIDENTICGFARLVGQGQWSSREYK